VDFSRLLAKCSTVVDRRPIIAPFTADVTGNSGVQERPGDYRYMLHALAVGVDGEWSVTQSTTDLLLRRHLCARDALVRVGQVV